MLILLSDMTLSQLESLKTRIGSVILEQELEINRRQKRLDDRLERQSDDTVIRDGLKIKLDKNKQVRDELVAAGSPAATIATAQELVDEAQKQLDDSSPSTRFISDVEAHIIQSEIDELVLGLQDKATKLSSIEALLLP
ncbi:MAG: hypothetical protein ACFB10_06110 [Salibacteraceae bacterium]